MVPPRNIILEIGDQLIWRRKDIGAFRHTEMSMITFPDFVVVAQNAFSTNNVRQSVLEPV
jgi:hypothetical protein